MPTKNMWQSQNPAQVSYGGTGDAALTPTYSVLCAGTTTTNPVQVVASNGSAGEVLTSNGTGILPTWQPITPFGNAMVLIATQTISSAVSSVVFTSIPNTIYNNFVLVFSNLTHATTTSPDDYQIKFSIDNGTSYVSSDYNILVITSTGPRPLQLIHYILAEQNFGTYSGGYFSRIPDISTRVTHKTQSGNIFLYNFSNNGNIPVYMAESMDIDFFFSVPGDLTEFSFANECMGSNTSITGGVDAVEISTAQGADINTGTFSLYGIIQ